MNKLFIQESPRTYIQSVVLKRQLESMLTEHKHGMKVYDEEYASAASQLVELACREDSPLDFKKDISIESDVEIGNNREFMAHSFLRKEE